MGMNTMDPMNVVYAANDGYARHLGVSLYSLLEHNRHMDSKIYILSAQMSAQNQQLLAGIAHQFGRGMEIVELGDLRSRFDFDIDTRGFNISAMSRLFCASALPAEVHRALYLDCDTVVLRPLDRLWKTDLHGKPVGMVMEPTVYMEMKAAIDLKAEEAYYNSGVILMDLDLWRKENLETKFLAYYQSKEGDLFACDQDTINGTLKGRIHTLSPGYNFFTNYTYFNYKTLTSVTQAYRRVPQKEFELAKKQPAIIHYMGDERPWIAGNHNPFRREYEDTLKKTVWAEVPPEKGKELYMQLYWGMNQITRICPPVRKWISKKFGMKVIDARKKT